MGPRCLMGLAVITGACGGVRFRPGGHDRARAPYTAAQLANVVDFAEVALAPDGHEVAFVTDRSGSMELWTLDLTRASASPRQRTHAEESVSGVRYSPDGGTLLFEMDHGGDERTDLYVLRGASDTPEPLTHTTFAEGGARYAPDGLSLALQIDVDRPFRFNVFVMDLATRTTTALTHEPINVQGARWSRDGRTVVATRSGDDQRGDLLVLDVTAHTQRAIAPPRADGIVVPDGFLPDGRLLAHATNARGFMQLAIVDLGTNAVTYVGPDEWDVEHVEIADDGTVLVARNVHGESEVTVRRAPTWAAETTLTTEGVVSDLAMDRAAHTAVMLREGSNRPVELVRFDLTRGGSETIVIPASVGDVVPSQLAHATRRTLPSFDRTPIDVFVWTPPVPRLGTPPPLVIHVHGGPNGQTRGVFSPTVQTLAEAGFVVASANYRGSTGYGRAFEDLNNHDWGGGDLRDLLGVVDALARDGVVDGHRVGIYGGSYGGYMTLRAITAAPTVWRAAVDMFGMPDLVEDARLTGDRFGSWYLTEMGDPVRDAALYRDRSPIFTIDRVRAPLLVLQGANDTNVPRAESDAMVATMRAHGQRVDYVVYPDEGHGFTHRTHRIDAMARTAAFFAHELVR